MQITEVKKKKYTLTEEGISAIKQVIDILEIICSDDDIYKVIRHEAYSDIEDTLEVLNVILNLDEIDIDY